MAMMHPDFDSKPSKNPFPRILVLAYRIECGEDVEEWFFVFEFDLVSDNLGPRTPRPRRTESDARIRLTELGLDASEVDARIAWARRWMATRIVKSKDSSVMWLPPL
jgi:hypothetical protein